MGYFWNAYVDIHPLVRRGQWVPHSTSHSIVDDDHLHQLGLFDSNNLMAALWYLHPGLLFDHLYRMSLPVRLGGARIEDHTWIDLKAATFH